MKKFILSLVIIIVVSVQIHAQLLSPFKASEGIPKAKEIAMMDSLMVEPELLAVGTMTGSVDSLNFELEYDISTGKSTAWMYIFRSKSDSSFLKVIGVLKFFTSFQGIELPWSTVPDIVPIPDSALSDSWIDSDKMAEKVNDNETFKSFLELFPDTKLEMLALGINNSMPLFEMGIPYWAGIYRYNASDITCITNAITGETLCQAFITDVENNNKEEKDFTIYPNPASSQAFIIIPENLNYSDFFISLSDNIGNVLKSCTGSVLNRFGSVYVINVSDISAGTYFIKISNSIQSYVKPLIIFK